MLPMIGGMSEKLVNCAWRTTLVALITIGALISAVLAYQSVLLALNVHWGECIPTATLAAAAAFGVWMLCRHRGDLVCD